MKDPCNLYKSQYKKAKDALDTLEKHKEEILFKLESNFASSTLHKELRTVNMDIRITLNEIEHAEYCIQRCELEHNSPIN